MAHLRAVVFGGLMTALFFASGPFVFLTPVTTCVYVARGHRGRAAATAVIAYGTLSTVYIALLPRISAIGQLIPLPGGSMGAALGQWIGQAFGLGYLGYYLAIGWALGEGFARGWRTTRAVAVAASLALVWLFLVAGSIAWFSHTSVIAHAQAYLRHLLLDRFLGMNTEIGIAPEHLSILREHADEIIRGALQIIPAFCGISALFVTALNVAVGRWFLRPFSIGGRLEGLGEWRSSFGLVWAVIGAGVAFFLDHYIVLVGWLEVASVNVLLVCAAIYLLQGLGVVQVALRRMPSWGRWLSYLLLVLFIQTAAPALAVLGLADVWGDFRRRIAQPKQPAH